MIILVAILIALIVPLLVLALSFTRLKSGLLWLFVLLGAFIAWLLVIFARGEIPSEITLIKWDPVLFLGSSPSLLLDKTTWPFAVAVMTISLAVLLTDVVNFRELDPQVWASNLALGGLGLLAVVAGNPLSLLLAWAVIDVSELVVLLIRVNGSRERERVVVAFSVRIVGMTLLIAAMLQARSIGKPLSFESIPLEVTALLLLSAGLRSGVIPPAQPFLSNPNLQRGLGSFARLIPVVSSMTLVVRVATFGVSQSWQTVFLIVAIGLILFAAFRWLQARDELQGRAYWSLGFVAFALASAAMGLVGASAAWSYALLFSGSVVFLFSFRQRPLLIIPVLGAVGFCTLPLTPTWEGIALFAAVPWGFRIAFILGLAIIFLGYVKHSQPVDAISDGFERWMWLVYPLGLLFLPAVHILLTYLQQSDGQNLISFSTSGWWYGIISSIISGILLLAGHRTTAVESNIFQRAFGSLDFGFVYRFFWRMYRLLGRLLTLSSRLLEGEGGVLWALVILILLVVYLSFLNTGDRFEF